MTKRILWVDDDTEQIGGLVVPLEKEGFVIDVARTGVEAFRLGNHWREYNLLLVDLIFPLHDGEEPLPAELVPWTGVRYLGVEILKWLALELQVQCPVLVLSVVNNPIARFRLHHLGLAGSLTKRGLTPSRLREEVYRVLSLAESS